MTHLLVVDDDDRLRNLIKHYLVKQGYSVNAVSNASQAWGALRYFTFDLIILDVMMPDEDGFTLLKRIREVSKIPVLMLTAAAESDQRIHGLEQGADDYLTKPFEPRELVLRLEAILRRIEKAPLSENLIEEPLEFSNFRLDPKAGQVRDHNGQPVRLTGSEITILIALVRNQGRVISRVELSHLANIQGGDRAIDVKIARLRQKLETRPKAPRHICTVHGQGYVFRP